MMYFLSVLTSTGFFIGCTFETLSNTSDNDLIIDIVDEVASRLVGILGNMFNKHVTTPDVAEKLTVDQHHF